MPRASAFAFCGAALPVDRRQWRRDRRCCPRAGAAATHDGQPQAQPIAAPPQPANRSSDCIPAFADAGPMPANHPIENISRIRSILLLSAAFRRLAIRLFRRAALGYDGAGRHSRENSMSRADLPCDRARCRRGHPHALGAAEGAARDRRPVAARPCARRGAAGGRHRRSPSWSGPMPTRSRPKRRACVPDAEIFVQAERRGTAHAVLAARRCASRAAPTTSWSSSPTRR